MAANYRASPTKDVGSAGGAFEAQLGCIRNRSREDGPVELDSKPEQNAPHRTSANSYVITGTYEHQRIL